MTHINRFRLLHRKLAPWFLVPLVFIAVTGLIYRIGRAWFGMSKETGGEIMKLHSGEWMGVNVSVVYLFLVGGALLFLVCSGLWMWFSGNSKSARRKSHRVLAITFSLPLVLSAVTGMAYHAGAKWFQMDEATLDILMSLHQGTWLGKDLRAYYILLLGTGMIALCLTGLRLCFRGKSIVGK
jgi:hypothetical protein